MLAMFDFDTCYRAISSRDQRFDGRFVTMVTSTKIYCRPSCPAITPKVANVQFAPTAAAAQSRGFRACLRCRPDAVAGTAEWNRRSDVVGRAMRLIEDGVVDREGVGGLATRLHFTPRHLNRMLNQELGAGAVALARARRASIARQLLEESQLPLTEAAFAAGFTSVRQFNETFTQIYGKAPSAFRSGTSGPQEIGAVRLELPFLGPAHVDSMMSFLRARTLEGLDRVEESRYVRTLRLPVASAKAAVELQDYRIKVQLDLESLKDLTPAVRRVRELFDVDADAAAIDACLAVDPCLSADVAKAPGVRVPGAVDGFEIAVRSVVGQQISVPAALKTTAKLLTFSQTFSEQGIFLTPEELLTFPDDAFSMPSNRRETLRLLARTMTDGLLIDRTVDHDETSNELMKIKGIGQWTATYIAMRAMGDTDAFLSTDLGVLRGAKNLGLPSEPKALLAHAERWRPWRSYANIRLWRHA